MFDLNKTPTLNEEGEVNPQDLGTEKKLQIQANLATSAAPERLASSSKDYTFGSSDLTPLLIMVQDLRNDHPGTPNLMFNSNHATLPPHTCAFSESPATAWRGSNSVVPKHLAKVTIAPGDGSPAVRDITARQGRVVEVLSRNGAGGGLRGNPNQASQCQTTLDLDYHIVSDGKSYSCKPRNSRDSSNSKAVLVDLDTLPNESPVQLQFPWNPVHQAPLHTTTCRMSSENLQVSATKLTRAKEEHRLREVAFHAAFKFETQRCTPAARCRTCLAFCQARLPKLSLPSLQEGSGAGGGLQLHGEFPNVLRNVVDAEAGRAGKLVRHGPKSKSSEYRGVTFYKKTGRWEAQIWHEGGQLYLGSSETKEEAARAYDQAALLLCGPDAEINFKPESYQMEMAYLYKLSKEQLVIYLRRDSRGFGARVSYPGVKPIKKYYKAMYGSHTLGTFAIEEDAARAVYKEAVRNSFGALASLILDIHHVRNMPSYAAQRFAALYPEAAEGTQLWNQAKAITSKRPSVPQRPSQSTSSPQNKEHWIRQARKPNQNFTSPVAASAIAAPPRPAAVEQLPGNKINENIEVSPGALTPTRGWGANLTPRTRHRHAAWHNFVPTQLQSYHHQPSNCNGTNTFTLQQLRNLLPGKFVHAPAATGASSSCHAPSIPPIPRATGEESSWAVIKVIKLFNLEISHKELEPQHCDELILPPRKKCKITGAAAAPIQSPELMKLCKKCKKCLLAQGRLF